MVYGLNATLAVADVLGAIINVDVCERLSAIIPGLADSSKVVGSSGTSGAPVELPSGWTVAQLASLD